MKSMTGAITAFAHALSAAWPAVVQLSEHVRGDARESLFPDWCQAMWEMLVEVAATENGTPVFLEVYGEGADCNPRSSRVYLPDALPTASIRCVPRSGRTVVDVLTGDPIDLLEQGIALDRLVRRDGRGWYEEGTPFDHVLLSGTNDIVVPLSDVEFVLEAITP